MEYMSGRWPGIAACALLLLAGGCSLRPATVPVVHGERPSLLGGIEQQVMAVKSASGNGEPQALSRYGKWLAGAGENDAAIRLLSPLAQRGDKDAACQLGLLLLEDRATAADGVKWLTRAAEAGVVTAQIRLAGMYRTGDGVPRDATRAWTWTRRAAEQGDAPSQNAAGAALFSGTGVKKDPAAAADWYRRSAGQGNPLAAFNLAGMYLQGTGVRRNAGVAYAWYALSCHNAPADNGAALSRACRQMMKRALSEAARNGRAAPAITLAERYIREYGHETVETPDRRAEP